MNPTLLHYIVRSEIAIFSMTTFVLANSSVSVSPTRRNNDNSTFTPGEIIWQDEFDFFDHSKWKNEINIEGGGNKEFQIYDKYKSNGYVRDGVLYIRPTMSLDVVFGGDSDKLFNGNLTLERCTDLRNSRGCTRQAKYPAINNPVVSQRLRTKGTFSFCYGRVEARARMPSGDWTWPAIWLFPEEYKYGPWPSSGEIDIVEARGNRKLFNKGKNIGSEQMGSTLHYGPYLPYNGWSRAHGTKNTPVNQGFDRDFHIYEVIWNTEMIQFKVDRELVHTVKPPMGGFFELGNFPKHINNIWVNGSNPRMAPFDENFHFIINVAIGGNFFSNDFMPPPPWGVKTPFLDFYNNRDSWLPTWNGENSAMAIDYIRVYAV